MYQFSIDIPTGASLYFFKGKNIDLSRDTFKFLRSKEADCAKVLAALVPSEDDDTATRTPCLACKQFVAYDKQPHNKLSKTAKAAVCEKQQVALFGIRCFETFVSFKDTRVQSHCSHERTPYTTPPSTSRNP